MRWKRTHSYSRPTVLYFILLGCAAEGERTECDFIFPPVA